MFESMRTSNPKVVTAIYYIAWIFIGNFVILNLLLAVIMDGFAAQDEEERELDSAEFVKIAEARQHAKREKRKQKRLKEKMMRSTLAKPGELTKEQKDMFDLNTPRDNFQNQDNIK